MAAYYNEIEPFAAHVLRQLIKDGVIADGDVDTRSIADVGPEDLAGYTQCHFFAGGGLWSVAARMAGWPDDRPLWTGSCPCQPFSVAGKGAGTDDPRHLWPHFHRLIRSCRPAVVMGEQVAGAAGYNWFDGVRSDLEGENYAARAVDIPACAVNAPHIRQRLYWVAQNMGVSNGAGWNARQQATEEMGRGHSSVAGSGECDMADAPSCRSLEPINSSVSPKGMGSSKFEGNSSRDMANAESIGRRGRSHDEDEGRRQQPSADPCEGSGDMADADIRIGWERGVKLQRQKAPGELGICGEDNVADTDDEGRQGWPVYAQCPDELSPWSRGVEWRRGADGKTRRVKSGVRLLVDGMPGRVGLLRIGGNAIVAPLAAEVIREFMESEYRE